MPQLARILIYPIKSLDPIRVEQARVLSGGALEFDRQWAIVDASGKFINGKRTPMVHRLRTSFDERVERVTFEFESRSASFHLSNEMEALESWLSKVFTQPVRLLENAYGGYPDDTEAPGPTVISTATLETAASWFPENRRGLSPFAERAPSSNDGRQHTGIDPFSEAMTVDECRLRFRANLEIGDVEPFWEDRLFGPAGSQVEFKIGNVTFAGTNPCQRCVVPSRDPNTGEVRRHFTPEFSQLRAASLPDWAERSRFDHFYRLAVNTHLDGNAGMLHVGDEVVVLG